MTKHRSRRQADVYPRRVAVRRFLAKGVWKGLRWALPDRHLAVSTEAGRMYLNLRESRMMLFRAFRVYEHWTRELVKALASPGMTAIDVGANKGDYTLLFAKLAGECGRVLAFEPDPENCAWLRRSIAANDYRNVRIHQYALSEKRGTATFYPGQVSGWGSLVQGRNPPALGRQPFSVPTAPLDDVLREAGISDVDLMKVDVEGGELLVLRGARRSLRATAGLKIVMDMDAREEAVRAEIFDLLRSAGYRVFAVGPELLPVQSLPRQIRAIFATKEDVAGVG
jgi:FkbM family methyltransferase